MKWEIIEDKMRNLIVASNVLCLAEEKRRGVTWLLAVMDGKIWMSDVVDETRCFEQHHRRAFFAVTEMHEAILHCVMFSQIISYHVMSYLIVFCHIILCHVVIVCVVILYYLVLCCVALKWVVPCVLCVELTRLLRWTWSRSRSQCPVPPSYRKSSISSLATTTHQTWPGRMFDDVRIRWDWRRKERGSGIKLRNGLRWHELIRFSRSRISTHIYHFIAWWLQIFCRRREEWLNASLCYLPAQPRKRDVGATQCEGPSPACCLDRQEKRKMRNR